ncbi:MAG: putative secreted protein [Acidobacteria bacterium]|nr:putative secreted protein [Acidobacteriota bacterium]
MNRVHTIAFRLLLASLLFCLCFATQIQAQTPSPSPSKESTKAPETKRANENGGGNPFAPAAPPPLPAGMTGSDANDPRAKLAPGMYDAGEAAMGIKHLMLLKKPDTFQLGSDDPDNAKVQKTLGKLGIGDSSKMPKPLKLVLAQLAFANSDLAFQGNYLFQGNFYGVNIYDISNPAKAALLTSMVCPGGQGDVSVYQNLLFMSVEQPNGRLDCGIQGFPPEPPTPAGAERKAPAERKPPAAQKDRFRGVRIFDIADIKNPKQVAAVQTCRGSHTHTLVIDPNDKNNVYIYVSGTSFVRQNEELAGCSGEAPDKDPNTALFRIDVIKVPLAAPQTAQVVSSPRVFIDPRTGALNGLNNGGTHGKDGLEKPFDSNQCHDITVYSALGLAAGACDGNGIVLDIKDPAHPKRLDAVNDPNYSYWHSASFSNDGTKIVFTDEWGGGLGARCRANDPNKWGADAVFHLKDNKLSFASYYKLPAAQTDSENCVAHNGSLIPIPGRDIEVQAWYQGGISIMDFTDAEHPVEIGYFDRGPIDPKMLVLGGDWSAYWYNGHIYASEIARGLDIFELTPTKFLTQNEIDAAKAVRVTEFNVQNQEKIEWPRQLVVAKAYVDQLERSQGLPADRIAALREAIQSAETSHMNGGDLAKLKGLAPSLEKSAAMTKSTADSNRLQALAEILKQPAN